MINRIGKGRFLKIKWKTVYLVSKLSFVVIGLGEKGDMFVQSNHKVPLELLMDKLCLKLLLFKETVSAAPSSSFAADLSSNCHLRNADKHNLTWERNYIHFSFKHRANGKPQDIYNCKSRRQICLGEGKQRRWLCRAKSQPGHQVKVKTDHVSGGESLLENRVCWFSPVRSTSASMSWDSLKWNFTEYWIITSFWPMHFYEAPK